MLGPEEVTSGLINDYTISSLELQEKAGIIPLTIFHLFEQVNSALKDNIEFTIKCSYLEIYNESINDLLSEPPAHNLKLREFPRLGMCVIGCTEKSVTCPEDVFACLALGTMNRITGATEMNQRSSRSHTLFVIGVEQKYLTGSTKHSKLNLVDLAGSEKVSKTGASGQALKEAQNINLSLTTLGRCIKALSSSKDEHIPFRESKLTMILKEALGGNAKTALICTISQKSYHIDEGKSTLKFAERAKKVQTKARSNVKKSPEELLAIIEQLKTEIAGLKKQTQNKGSVTDDDISVRYAELKAQYDSMSESAQYEIEQLKARVEQLLEPAMRYPLQIQEHLDRIEDLNSHLSAVLTEKEALRKTYEVEIVTLRCRSEATARELEVMKAEKEAAFALVTNIKEELFDKEQECEKISQKLDMADLLLKSEGEKSLSLRETILKLSTDMESLQQEHSELQQSVSTLLEKEAIMQSDLLRSRHDLEQATKDNQQWRALATASNNRVAELEQAVKEATLQLLEKEEVITKLAEEARRTAVEHQMQLVAAASATEAKPKAAVKNESPSKSHQAKHMLSRLVKEMADLQAMYQETHLHFRAELAKMKEKSDEHVRHLEGKITKLTEDLEIESKKNTENIRNLKLAAVEEESLRFYLTKTKGEIANLTSELSKEKSAKAALHSALLEANAQLEAFKRLQTSGHFVTDAEMTTAKQNMRTAERRYRSSLDDIQTNMLRFTAENSKLSEALAAKEAEIMTLVIRIRELECQTTVLKLQVEKDEHKIKMIRLVRFRQKNRSSVAQLSRGRLVSRVTQEVKLSHLSFSAQSHSSEEEKTLADKTWKLPHRDLYGMQDVQTLYSNDGESDCSVKRRLSAAEESSDEEREAEDVLE